MFTYIIAHEARKIKRKEDTKMRLIELSLSNFKCFSEFDVNFADEITEISGDNGTGKTSVCDAYFWLLFGKNAAGQTFNPRPKKSEATKTTVTAKLELDSGEEVYLTRSQRDKGQKSNETAKSATETTYMINDVPKKKKDFEDFVSQICAPKIFNVLSNPLYFAGGTQKNDWQNRREVLVSTFANEGGDDKIINNHADLAKLREHLGYMSVNDFLDVTSLERKKTQKRLDEIPVELNVHQQTIDDTETEGKYEPAVVAKLTIEKSKIEKEIQSIVNGDKIVDCERQIAHTKAEIELAEVKFAREHNNSDELMELDRQLIDLKSKKHRIENSAAEINNEIEHAKRKANEARAKYADCASETLSIDPVCPTCHQNLPEYLISQKEEMFNQQRAENMKKAKEEYQINSDSYKKKKDELEKINSQKCGLDADIEKLESERKRLANPRNAANFEESDEYKKLSDKLDSLESEYSEIKSDTDKLVAEKHRRLEDVQAQINAQESIKAAAVLVEKQKKRIKELRDEQLRLGKLLAKQDEGIDLVQKFLQYKISDVEEQINSHFKIVKWKLFEPQVNGIIKDCCEATVDGVGFNDGLNAAARINAGLDIINALSDIYGVEVPVWIDNAESVVRLIETKEQQIRLSVDENQPNISIKHNGGKL